MIADHVQDQEAATALATERLEALKRSCDLPIHRHLSRCRADAAEDDFRIAARIRPQDVQTLIDRELLLDDLRWQFRLPRGLLVNRLGQQSRLPRKPSLWFSGEVACMPRRQVAVEYPH